MFSIFRKKENKKLLENFLSLTILQVANYLLPLITVPYLIRVLGFEYFGLISFALVTVEYFMLLTNYGFELTATREIAIYQKNMNKLSEIFSSVLTIKFFLLIISLLILTLVILSFEKFQKNWIVYYLTFGMVIGNVLFPSWFFQGMENMKYITILNFISKIIFVLFIFIFIKNQNDYYLVPFFNSLGFIFIGILAQIIIFKQFRLKFIIPSFSLLKTYLLDGWHIFLSRIYVNIYTTTNVLLLGLLTNNTQVGYYTVIEKIVLAFGRMLDPVNQVLFPYLSKTYKNNIKLFLKKIINLSKIFIIISLSIFIISFLLRNQIIYLITGEYNKEISFLLGIFLLRVVTYPLAPLFANGLIIMKRNKEYLRVMNITVLLNFIFVPVSIYFGGIEGLVVSFIFVIYIHVLLLFFYIKKFSKLTT